MPWCDRDPVITGLLTKILSDLWAGYTYHLPYNSYTTSDVLDVIITKGLVTIMYLTARCALSQDHLPVLINTVSIILPQFTRLPQFKDWLAQIPSQPGNWASVWPWHTEWGGRERLCLETVMCYFEEAGRINTWSFTILHNTTGCLIFNLELCRLYVFLSIKWNNNENKSLWKQSIYQILFAGSSEPKPT